MASENLKKTIKQFIKFALIGVLNTLVDLVVLNIETLITGIKDGPGFAVQKGVSFLVAVTGSYFFNKYWAFQDTSKKQQGKKFSQFLAISVIGMLINVTTATITATYIKPVVNEWLQLAFLTDQIWVNIAALTGTAVGLIWNFIGYKLIVFKK